MPPALSVRGLEKRFGARKALAGVDFDIQRGEFYTLFGPNGAGKTTLIRCLSTLARPSAGRVTIQGRDLADGSAEMRAQFGVVSHRSYLYGELTARENLEFFASMYGFKDAPRRAIVAAESVDLGDRLDDPVGTFSRGLEQRCAIARALVHDPEILLFDEPFSGLDPLACDTLEQVLRDQNNAGKTLLMTSHDLARGAQLAQRIGVLHRGVLHPCEGVTVAQMPETYRRIVSS